MIIFGTKIETCFISLVIETCFISLVNQNDGQIIVNIDFNLKYF